MGNKKKEQFFKKHENDQKNIVVTINDSYPKFSFEFCFVSNKSVEKINKSEKVALIEKIVHLSKITWAEIKALPRQQGFEKIDKKSFQKLPGVPALFKDENKITVFRLPSGKGRLVGYIVDETFFIVWVDTKFDMYKH
ncbi:hypothetical protein [Shewanella colwelliana]|uniref:hypothetical protein n=1 Tax=Shewanella colwelliana TaxID=23 RepID=UPI0022AFE14A|nr:hypothetical protein [Shewanella colwelliana]MCZ4337127.1 hypothetical protein [Shewanella colwelliana]